MTNTHIYEPLQAAIMNPPLVMEVCMTDCNEGTHMYTHALILKILKSLNHYGYCVLSACNESSCAWLYLGRRAGPWRGDQCAPSRPLCFKWSVRSAGALHKPVLPRARSSFMPRGRVRVVSLLMFWSRLS